MTLGPTTTVFFCARLAAAASGTGSLRFAGGIISKLPTPGLSVDRNRAGLLSGEARRCFATAKGKTKGEKAARAIANQTQGELLSLVMFQTGRSFETTA